MCPSLILQRASPKEITTLNFGLIIALFFLIVLPHMLIPISNIFLVFLIAQLYKIELSYMYSFVTVLFAKYVFEANSY